MGRHSRDQWKSWLSEHPSSGLTVAEFCIRQGIQPQSFYRWRRKLAQEEATSSAAVQESPFVSVSMISMSSIEIDLPCGATVRVPADQSSLERVFRTLLAIGANA